MSRFAHVDAEVQPRLEEICRIEKEAQRQVGGLKQGYSLSSCASKGILCQLPLKALVAMLAQQRCF